MFLAQRKMIDQRSLILWSSRKLRKILGFEASADTNL